MKLTLFLLLLLASCLLWTATFTAAAARSRRFGTGLLLVGVVLPLVVLLPLLAITAWLAFGPFPIPDNRWLPVAATTLSAIAGGIWIVASGRRPAGLAGAAAARRWPVVPLAALAAAAAIGTAATIAHLERQSALEAVAWYAEGAAIMESNQLPPVPATVNAAALYRQAESLLEDDPDYIHEDWRNGGWDDFDVGSPQVGDLIARHAGALARHAGALDLIRRATDRDICRFDGDQTSSIDFYVDADGVMLNHHSRLLAFAALHAAREGRSEDAIADVLRIRRLAGHAMEMEWVVGRIRGGVIVERACKTLASVCFQLQPADLPLLDDARLAEAFAPLPPLLRPILQEESQGLALFASVATHRLTLGEIDYGYANIPRDDAPAAAFLGMLYRAFLIQSELERFRAQFKRVKALAADVDLGRVRLQDAVRSLLPVDDQSDRGILNFWLWENRVWQGFFYRQMKVDATISATRVAVAATRHRLKTGHLPDSLDDLVPEELPFPPRDPFTTSQPLRLKKVDEGIVVWWVGWDGEDDGGPSMKTGDDFGMDGTDGTDGNDDLGLWVGPDDFGRPSE
ncbi:MAG: hypothetical protein RLZZ326_1939 [Planctomycetota bacterium]|jgi:hypothetical protein